MGFFHSACFVEGSFTEDLGAWRRKWEWNYRLLSSLREYTCLNLIKKLGIGPERLGLMLRIKVYGYVSSGMDAGILPTILFELKIARMLTREDMVFRIILHCKLIHYNILRVESM